MTTNEVPKHSSLIEALAAAQSEFTPITKDKKAEAGARGSYRYADLSDILAVVRPALNRHSIALLQTFEPLDGGGLMLHTELRGYGETLESSLPIPGMGGQPQAFGSAVSYARKYSLAALVGVAAENEDDDGHEATRRPPPRTARDMQPAQDVRTGQLRDRIDEEARRVVPPDDAWLEAAKLKVEHAEPDELRTWWNSDAQKRQRQDLHKRRADFAQPLAELKARVAARWWECSSLEIQRQDGRPDWQRWQGDVARAVDAAPDLARLTVLEHDNLTHLDGLREAVPKAHEALAYKIESQRLLLADNETPIDLGGDV